MINEKALTEVILDENGKTIKISIPASMDFSSMLRDFIGGAIQNDTKFSQKWKHRLQLMADELINNAIEHGSTSGDPVHIKITIYNNSDIEIIVEDSGTGKSSYKADGLIERSKQNREIMMADPMSNKTIRGRGIAMIVMNWSDDFIYEDNDMGGLTAKLLKKYSQDCAEQI